MPVVLAENLARFERQEGASVSPDLHVVRAAHYDLKDLFDICIRGKLRSLASGADPLITEDMVRKQFQKTGTTYRSELAIKFARALGEADPELGLLKLTKRGQRVGSMILSMENDGQWLNALSIAKTGESQGYGAYMLSSAIERAQGLPLHLEAVDYNQRAIGLYARMGFEATGEERPGYRFDDVQTTLIKMTHPGARADLLN